ncbi:TIGR03943 family putative permease subunit [Paractinoplanes rishiriensis]|uniref:Membrane protein n=1 Tax=Paractinoplanes rishiriensis TaxID=1050105 RepID=A0A919K127_9ACTN|nr:TIGR03943 family protein [Actinoplanes rishiriensis]GIE97105.1 membrane protein [Actinoplanes rishiriensis]
MSRLTQAVVLLLFGGAVLRASLTDLYLRYVKEGLRPFLIAAGVLMVAAAITTIWYSLRSSGKSDEEQHDHGHEGHHEPRVGWLLILPVLGLLLVAPPALGSFAAGQSGSVTAAPSDSDYPPLPPGDPAPVALLDYASRALFDDGRSLTGRTLKLTGFITPAPDGKPMLARIVLSCCAADGRPIKVGMTGQTPIEVPADTWVEITGVYSPQRGKDPVNDVDVAFVEVKSWQEVAQPKNPYS